MRPTLLLRVALLGLFSFAALHAAPSDPSAPDPLAAGFAHPPTTARPLVWWHWVNGNISKHGIEADLADMKRVGIGGVQMFDVSIYLPPGPIRYGTPIWHEHVKFAMETAEKLGLEFYAMNTPGWSASGGPWVTPERSMKQLVWTETAAPAGAAALDLVLAQPTTKLGFYRDVAVLAVPADAEKTPRRTADLPVKTRLAEKSLVRAAPEADPTPGIPRSSIIDLTKSFDGSTQHLHGTLPPGQWTILRFGFTSTGSTNHPAVPEGHGLEIDKLDPDAVSFQFDQAIEPLVRDAGPRAGTTFKGLLFDSFEGGPQNWTDTFPQQFSALKGYDLIPLLPALAGRVIENATFTECVLFDFRTALDDLIAKNYFGTMQRRAHAHGMVLYAEAQGGPLNPMICDQYVDVPMNEFWMPDTSPRSPRLKMVASITDLLGRSVVGAESFTAKPEDGSWTANPARLKSPGDGAWAAGINRFIFHHYTHQPTDDGPGFGLGRYGTEFGRLNTWWPLAGGWVDYIARGQFLLQPGRTVADICFLQNEDHGYGFPPAMVDVPPGYDFEICYPRHLATMTWQNGALVSPAGPSYRLLSLPDNWAADLPTLRHLRELVRAGAAIVGAAPVAPIGVRDYEGRDEFATLVKELWGNATTRGPIQQKPLAAALHDAHVSPDVVWPAYQREGDFRFIHRHTAEADVYFVFNHAATATSGEIAFRTRDRQPELWDAVAGTHGDAPVFRQTADGVAIPLQLEPNGSRFIVFRHPLPSRWIASTAPANLATDDNRFLAPPGAAVTVTWSDGKSKTTSAATVPADIAVAGPWQVAFVDGRGAPPETTFATLTSWTDNADKNIKFYSGVATYRTTLDVPGAGLKSGAAAFLDLGAVDDLAEVRLNGSTIRILWQPPFRVDVTRELHAGSNTLEVRVANRWINRVIGDESLPTDLTYQVGTGKFTEGALQKLPAWLYDRTKIADKQRYSFTTWKHYTAASPLVPSGLLGPVRIEWRAVITP